MKNEIEVDGQPIHSWLENVIRDSGKEKGIARLNLASCASKLASASKGIDDWRVASDSWDADIVWDDQRRQLQRLVVDWRAAVRAFDRHRSAVNDVLVKTRKAQKDAKVEWRKVRDNFRRWLTGRGVPESLAKSAGDLLREVSATAESVGIKLVYVRPVMCSAPMPLASFTEPFLILEPQKKSSERSQCR